jgi:hypothetical protein
LRHIRDVHTESARPCQVQAQELGGYICFLIGGVGRMRRRESESGEILSVERREEETSSEKHLVLYRDIPLSIEATNQRQRRIPEFLLSTSNSHAFLNFPTKSFGRTTRGVTWFHLCS